MPDRGDFLTEADFVDARIEDALSEVHTATVGVIERYDPATQTATVRPVVERATPQSDGTCRHEAMPVLPRVPVIFPRSGAWAVTWSLVPGDSVLLVSLEQDASGWRAGRAGATVRSGDTRRHHLAHSVAIPGLYPRAAPIEDAPPAVASGASSRLSLGAVAQNATRLHIHGDGRLTITRGSAVVFEVTADGVVASGGPANIAQALGIAELIDARLETLRAAINGHTHPATSGTTSPTVDGQVTPLASVAASKAMGR